MVLEKKQNNFAKVFFDHFHALTGRLLILFSGKSSKLHIFDLFAGAGGLSEGFIKAGYTPIAHVEMKLDACNTLKTRASFHYLEKINRLDIYENYLRNKREGTDGSALWNQVPPEVTEKVIHAAIGDDTMPELLRRIDELDGGNGIDLIIGGPPCQAYSVAGRARLGEKVKEDPRNFLYLYYIQFIEHFRPKMFVFENVVGIQTARKGEPFRDLQERVRELGYEIEAKEQLASNFGVLQHRRRMIIVGWRNFNENGNHTNYHYPDLIPHPTKYQIRKDLLSDLPARVSGQGKLCETVEYTRPDSEMEYLVNSGIRSKLGFTTQHVARRNNENDREIYTIAINKWRKGERLNYATLPERLQHHKNKRSFLNRFSVVDPNGCCHTVVAHIAMDGHYYIYPTENPTIENARSITVREAARIQSFPDDYYFEGSRTSAFMQIGNAVPVMMAYNIAEALLPQLDKE